MNKTAMNNEIIETKTNTELSVEELDDVNGGIFISGGAFLAWSIAYAGVTLASAYTLGRMNRK